MHDHELLRDYAKTASEPVFAELVARYIGLVHSAALRQVRDAQHAEDITQAVFIVLARKAASLAPGTVLSGWLLKTTRYAANAHIRAAIRRAQREEEAAMQSTLNEPDSAIWDQLAPHLDEAMASLGDADRNAIALRYFESRTWREVAERMHVSEDAAQKRVTRALEKLRTLFAKHGVTLSAGLIAGAVSINSVQAAPMGMVKSISVGAATKGAAATVTTSTLVKGAMKLMAFSKAKTVAVIGATAILVAGTSTAVVEKLFKSMDSDPTVATKLEEVPPHLILRPTQYPTNGVGFQNPSGKAMAANVSFEELLRFAYGFSSSARMLLPNGLPQGQFDYLNNLGTHQRDALRGELKKKFGIVAHVTTNTTDVLLLEVRSPEKLKAHLAQNEKPTGLGTFKMSRGKRNEEVTGFETMQLAELLETIFHKPVIDQTGSESLYEWKNKAESSLKGAGREDGWRRIIAHLGLELVPTNAPVEMLVVEKLK